LHRDPLPILSERVLGAGLGFLWLFLLLRGLRLFGLPLLFLLLPQELLLLGLAALFLLLPPELLSLLLLQALLLLGLDLIFLPIIQLLLLLEHELLLRRISQDGLGPDGGRARRQHHRQDQESLENSALKHFSTSPSCSRGFYHLR